MYPPENSSDEERPLTRSESRRRAARNRARESQEERSPSSNPLRGRLTPDTVRDRSVSRLLHRATEPDAVPDPSRSYQPEPSTSAYRDAEYSCTASSSTRSSSGRLTFAEGYRSLHYNQPATSDGEPISHKAHKIPRRFSVRTFKCRFCLQGEDGGILEIVCGCSDNMRFAHNKCLQKELKKSLTQCPLCGDRFRVIQADGNCLMEEPAIPMEEPDLSIEGAAHPMEQAAHPMEQAAHPMQNPNIQMLLERTIDRLLHSLSELIRETFRLPSLRNIILAKIAISLTAMLLERM